MIGSDPEPPDDLDEPHGAEIMELDEEPSGSQGEADTWRAPRRLSRAVTR